MARPATGNVPGVRQRRLELAFSIWQESAVQLDAMEPGQRQRYEHVIGRMLVKLRRFRSLEALVRTYLLTSTASLWRDATKDRENTRGLTAGMAEDVAFYRRAVELALWERGT